MTLTCHGSADDQHAPTEMTEDVVEAGVANYECPTCGVIIETDESHLRI